MNSATEKSQTRILIVEDDKDIAELICLHLKDLNFATVHCADGAEGLSIAESERFDLLILDLMLPGLDGLEICRQLRKRQPYVPIIMLTSRSDELDRVLGLEMGADDYLTKPFSVRELTARVRAVLRRVESAGTAQETTGVKEPIRIGELAIDVEKRRVFLSGKPVELTLKEFDLLHLFASKPGVVFSRESLLRTVWGYQFEGYEHTVNSHINRLRAKIETDPANPKYVKTVWGYGYRFADTEELES